MSDIINSCRYSVAKGLLCAVSTLYALKNWDLKMRGDIFYEMKYLIQGVMYRGIGIEFCWVPSHCGLYWNEISDKLAKQSTMKDMSEPYKTYYSYYC